MGTIGQWAFILFVGYATFDTVKRFVRPRTTLFWTVIVAPFWFGLFWGGGYMVYAFVTLAINFEFMQILTLLVFAVVMAVLPAPLIYYLHSEVLGERRAQLILPIALYGTWGWFFTMLIPLGACILAGVTLDDSEE